MFIDENKKVAGLNLFDNPFVSVAELEQPCRKIAAEGSVLLKNEDNVLPFKKGEKVAVFGRIQTTYYKSGTGSGGDVKIKKHPSIIESLKKDGSIIIDEELLSVYKKWIEENPFNDGHGWAKEPWCQEEMPLADEVVKNASKRNDAALIIIGRTAGEDHDNAAEKGSWYLTDKEENMISLVSKNFKRVAVVLNVGNLIDLSFADKYSVNSVMYAWQGGMYGADGLADALCGKISPSGKLTDTQPKSIVDCPSYDNFGDNDENIYQEDIYVGYRYFETFAKDSVMYPFGFGLTYTDFKEDFEAKIEGTTVTVTAKIKNIGDFPARQVAEVYYGAPCGKLGAPEKQLIGYKKTKTLNPDEEETLEIKVDIKALASYDDGGVTGNRSSYVLEAGKHIIYAGTDVRSAEKIAEINLENIVVVEKLEEAMAPSKPFDRLVAREENGKTVAVYEPTPLKTDDTEKRRFSRRPEDIEFTGDKGIKLSDVYENKNTLDEFVAQMTEDDLIHIVCGEGMNSPKVTDGTGGAIGGTTEALRALGIPVTCVTDGPSGLRIQDNWYATSLPNGMVFASSFDDELTEEIFDLEGVEMFRYNIDGLLGPGINIHRNLLNGRNFEYFSEDPLLTGKMAAAMSRALSKSNCSTTIKHMCGNNQETRRHFVNSVVSERALREIYLRPFEIAVKESECGAIMTSYNPVNSYWSASNYDLTTTILRGEWGYKGLVMTDWWARCGDAPETATTTNLKDMVKAQNDIYMVCIDAASKANNIREGLRDGYITIGELQRCTKNILGFVLKSNTFIKVLKNGGELPEFPKADETDMKATWVYENIKSGDKFYAKYGGTTPVLFTFEVSCSASELSQNTIRFKLDGSDIDLVVNGTNGEYVEIKRFFPLEDRQHGFICTFGDEIDIRRITIKELR